ncbi:Thymidylate kinase [Corynebacterium ciconiae DSM 44920]|uniref:dTMP kinase n=1 Tax=Corynebacterium ciconiae TaxID=227319 RepID=UPI000368FC06|nr:dTMP kinase [Corynebacterium ciconiae]WKD61806.1 Thymidylate kinase [Corynebacterium ciconiae DSM 44920]
MLVAVEGIDGAGKNTLVTALKQRITGLEVLAFPRYADSIHAQLADRALKGQMGDLISSVHGMATLFALDRREVVEQLSAAQADPQRVLLLDRYVASNAAYTSARLNDESAVEWISQLEFGTCALPAPDLQVLLDTPVEVAADRARRREAHDANRTRDAYERDADLQTRTAAAYRRLAAAEWVSPWIVASAQDSPEKTAERIMNVVGMEV